jgi:2-dehydropantoate 2-reductase
MSTPSIHVIGIGNLGKLLAHSLRRHHPEIPITLLFHRPSLVEEWEKVGKCIEITRNGEIDRQTGFTYETVPDGKSEIQNLIVATKTHSTVQALRALRDRLGPRTTLLFTQNGIGTYSPIRWFRFTLKYLGTTDEVTSQLFSQSSSRPNYLGGIINHGVYATSTFSSVHAGLASAFIGPISSSPEEVNTSVNKPSTPFLAQKIAECPELTASIVTAEELFHIQLQKLVVNAVINPLTSIFDCYNGELFQNGAILGLIDQVISEISAVTLAILDSKGQLGDANLRARFSQGVLTEHVYSVGEQTARNISSMRQDVLAGRKTEIDYINGYVVKQGKELGVDCPINATIVEMVKDKRKISISEIPKWFKW